MVVFAIMAVLLALLLPAVQAARAMASRLECANHLRQLGVGLAAHHAETGAFPSGHSVKSHGGRYRGTGWQFWLLPYIEQADLYQRSLSAFAVESWYLRNPPHVGMSTVVRVYTCPLDTRAHLPRRALTTRVALTSYPAVSGTDQFALDGTLFSDSRIAIDRILDGSSMTIVVGERPPSPDHHFGWWYAASGLNNNGAGDMLLGVRELNQSNGRRRYPLCPDGPYHFQPGRLADECDTFHFWSLHAFGGNFLFADGSVRFLSYSADGVLPALSTRAGGEIAILGD